MRRILLSTCFALASLCTACKMDMSPIVDGTVTYSAPGQGAVEQPLGKEQIAALTQWITRSSDGWGRCLMTPPDGPWGVTLHHADGTTSTLSLLKFRDEPAPSTLRADHLSGTNLVEQHCALQHFTASDIDALRDILAVPKT